MIFKGLRFGMLLQLAIGPVCIFVLQVAVNKGFFTAETGVLGVTLIDGFFILAAIFGVASVIKKKNVKYILKIFGAVILFAFGINIILGQFNISLLPNIAIHNSQFSNSIFLRAVLLTISSPLTILFWAGVFSTKITEGNFKREDNYLYGFGALMSTTLSLTLVALVGSVTKMFLPTQLVQVLDGVVGVMLMYFAIRMILQKAG